MELPDLLPNRLNADAVVFMGCTMKELQWIVIGTLVASVTILGTLAAVFLDMFMVGAALSFPVTVAFTWIFAKFLQRLKQGRPKGYLKQRMWRFLVDVMGAESPYVRREGRWTLGKSLARYL